ncbi:DUF6343 family protein [Streptomyces sp. NPDC006645]|uniref:DUF6343 family protein n=1 Tax=unclassified Streptomyces TaxID=2593676 RepID=UPI0033A06E69
MRTGNEPVTARSPLRMRWWLSVWGLIWAAFGTIAFAVVGRPGWAIACGVLLLIVAADFVLVVRHRRQGSRFQPGRDVPPYEASRHRHGGGDRRGGDDYISRRTGRRNRNARP